MKLHLGCGTKKLPGYTNIDIENNTDPDVVLDIKNIYPTYKNVNEIYACHVLEHFGRNEYKEVLNNWYQALARGGVLRISVPDFYQVCQEYTANKNLTMLLGFLNGGQKNKYDFHYMNFDFSLLAIALQDIGFKNIVRYNWKLTEHSHIDDYSQAYLPHMEKDNGRLMSLNIRATK